MGTGKKNMRNCLGCGKPLIEKSYQKKYHGPYKNSVPVYGSCAYFAWRRGVRENYAKKTWKQKEDDSASFAKIPIQDALETQNTVAGNVVQ